MLQMVGADCRRRVLLMLSPVLTLTSSVLTCLALLGGSWLLTEERVVSRGAGDGHTLHFEVKKTESGLFRLCQSAPGATELECQSIDYSGQGGYRLDPNDATLSIPYTAVRSSPFFLVGACLLGVAEVLWLWGHVRKRGAGVSTFVAGVVFIVQGLIMMMGCVMYISTLKGEVWHKLWPKSVHSPALFVYSYGRSFVIMMAAFTCSELAGISLVMLFIYWHIETWQQDFCGTPPGISSALVTFHSSLIPGVNLEPFSASSIPLTKAVPSDCLSCAPSLHAENDQLFPNFSFLPYLINDGASVTTKEFDGKVESSEGCRGSSSLPPNCVADIHFADSDTDDSSPGIETRNQENLILNKNIANKPQEHCIAFPPSNFKHDPLQNLVVQQPRDEGESGLRATGTGHVENPLNVRSLERYEIFDKNISNGRASNERPFSDGSLVPVVVTGNFNSQELKRSTATGAYSFSAAPCCCSTQNCCSHCCRQQKVATQDSDTQTEGKP